MGYESGLGSNGAPFVYAVDVKGSKIKTRRILFISLYVLFVIVLFAIFAIAKLFPVIALVPVAAWFIIWRTWKYTQLSYEYYFFQGSLTVNRCMGLQTKKEVLSIKLKSITEAIKCDGSEAEKIRDIDPKNVYWAVSSTDAPDQMLLIYNDESNEKKALYFEYNENALKIMRYYNSNILSK